MPTLAELELDARTTLAAFCDPACSAAWPAISRALQPRDADYARIVVGRAVGAVRAYGERVWADAPVIAPPRDHVELQLQLCWARDLAHDRAWPRGYRRLAEVLLPDVAWARVRFCARGERRGVAYDALVRVDDRWIWLPRPWRAVPRIDAVSHWAD